MIGWWWCICRRGTFSTFYLLQIGKINSTSTYKWWSLCYKVQHQLWFNKPNIWTNSMIMLTLYSKLFKFHHIFLKINGWKHTKFKHFTEASHYLRCIFIKNSKIFVLLLSSHITNQICNIWTEMKSISLWYLSDICQICLSMKWKQNFDIVWDVAQPGAWCGGGGDLS